MATNIRSKRKHSPTYSPCNNNTLTHFTEIALVNYSTGSRGKTSGPTEKNALLSCWFTVKKLS